MDFEPPDVPSAPRAAADPPSQQPEPSRVVVTDVQIPFGSMVVLILKFALASIPAAIILFILFAVFAGIFSAVVGR